jgi:hypothetical protein
LLRELLKNKTRPDWEEQKAITLEYIRQHSGEFNGAEISFVLNHSLKDLKVINDNYVGYYKALQDEGLIKYDYDKQVWNYTGKKKKTGNKISDYLND